nr:MAG TPA: hypothetical protein [Bacteriophage sp.]
MNTFICDFSVTILSKFSSILFFNVNLISVFITIYYFLI